jgi:glutathione-regulated potassium-efflux system protein KefB
MTPLLLLIDRKLVPKPAAALQAFDQLPEADGHVIIAGFGRFGQVIARVLRAKNIPFTALDISPEQVELVKRFGADAFYGDVSRLEILEAAQAGKARAFVLAIDDIEASIRTVQLLHEHYPGLAIYARARNRVHAHRLLDAGVKKIIRETFHSSIEMTEALLRGLGMSNLEARRTVRVFQAHDERRLIEDYKFWTDEQKLRERAQSSVVTLQQLLEEDTAEQAVADGNASPRKRPRTPVVDGGQNEPAVERSVAKDARETTP